MARRISSVTYVVPDYDAGIAFFCECLGFDLIEDTLLSAEKRWVLVAPHQGSETRFLIAKAASPSQTEAIGNQAGGRVGFIFETDDFDADFTRMQEMGVHFEEAPRSEAYGKVAVFQDPWGNRWDLIEFADA